MKRTPQPSALALGAFAAGTLGAVLNIWLFSSRDSRGLFPAGHPAATALWVLGLVALAGCVAALFLQKSKSRFVQKSASLVDALGAAVAAAGLLIIFFTGHWAGDLIAKLTQLLCLLSAGSFLVIGYCRYAGKPAPFILYMALTLFFMLYPISQHSQWVTQTQFLDFAFPIASAISLMLYSYRYCSLALGDESCRWTVFSGLLAIFTCLCSHSVPHLLLGFWVLCSFDSLLYKPQLKPMELPSSIVQCLTMLNQAGHRGYLVGGCVRDHILGIPPHDFDLCTDATPQELCQIFGEYNLVRSGEKHGTIGVVMDHQVIEITTFRTEGGYQDNRHPDWVKFVTDLDEDLRRRDFTVNAIAYNPDEGFADPFGGIRDLAEKTLRAVGDPMARFQEDALRILRGVRFALRFSLTPEKRTLTAMKKLRGQMSALAAERIFDELCKILPLLNTQAMCQYAPIFAQVLPELKPMMGFNQHSPHHAYDVYVHTAYVVQNTPQDLALRWAALLHDTGKPQVFTQDENGRGHFYDHARESGVIADDVMRRLKAPTALRDRVCFLVENHMLLLEADKQQLTRRLRKYGPDNLRDLIALQKADQAGKGIRPDPDEIDLDTVSAILDEIIAENTCLHIKDLAVNGQDFIALGFEPGPKIGQCLNSLLELVSENKLPNDKAALLEKAKTLLEGENL